MKNINIAGIILALMSQATCLTDSDYEGSDDDSLGMSYESSDDAKSWPLNMNGSLRHRLTLNGALAVPGSFVCSPISALLPLGKLALGATGRCKQQLFTAIGVSTTSELLSSFKLLLRSLKSVSGVELKVCSKIYVSKDYKLKSKFQEDAKEIFKSTIHRINLKKAEKVTKKINEWVKEKTKGMIKEILQPDDISPDSSVILVNAVYFSAPWKHQFSPAKMEDFFMPTNTRKVPMMTKSGRYMYGKNDALDCQVPDPQAPQILVLPNDYEFAALAVEILGPWSADMKLFMRAMSSRLIDASGDPRAGAYASQGIALAIQRGKRHDHVPDRPARQGILFMIEIPYRGGQASFVILLPNTKDGLSILLYKLKLAPELIQVAIEKMKMENVILSIPKFKTETDIDLKDAYEKLGLTDMMNHKDSGLTGIVKETGLYVSKAIQKAVIEVDEYGTKAAAASVVETVGTSFIINKIVFNANKPFFYFIKIKKEIIFSGVYVD